MRGRRIVRECSPHGNFGPQVRRLLEMRLFCKRVRDFLVRFLPSLHCCSLNVLTTFLVGVERVLLESHKSLCHVLSEPEMGVLCPKLDYRCWVLGGSDPAHGGEGGAGPAKQVEGGLDRCVPVCYK